MKLDAAGHERDYRGALDRLHRDRAIERIWAEDASLWKAEEEHGRTIREALGWLTIPGRMEAGLPELADFAARAARHTDRVVVLGMGGSSLAPLVFASSFRPGPGHPALEVLDSTEPSSVRHIADRCDPSRTLYVVSSKSGTTLEPNVFFDYFYSQAQSSLGGRAGERFAIVTDPGSALERDARGRGIRAIFPGDPRIGGRYSALSNFGMLPAALLGVDVAELLRRARAMADRCRREVPENPGALLGAAMGVLAAAGRDKLTFSVGRPVERFGMWAEQLIAESTGKEGKGILPVEGEALGGPERYGNDRFFVRIEVAEGDRRPDSDRLALLRGAGHPTAVEELSDPLDLGAEMFLWEFAAAVAGTILQINPFDQPNVQEAKERTNEILSGKPGPAGANRGGMEGLRGHLASLRPGDYFAITAYVPSTEGNERALERTRLRVRDARRVATTLGFGPRFLHSTGQFHKGGPDTGAFLQITAEPAVKVPIPGRPYGFEDVVAAQAAGDLAALESRGRRVLRAHLTADVAGGLAAVDAAVAAALEA